MPIGSLLKQQI
jgi:hypothetical protein